MVNDRVEMAREEKRKGKGKNRKEQRTKEIKIIHETMRTTPNNTTLQTKEILVLLKKIKETSGSKQMTRKSLCHNLVLSS